MGTWGPKLYQDDIAEDVKSDYIDMLKRGKHNDDITKELITKYQDAIDDYEDAPVFWFSLANIQWEYGRLLPNVKDKALEYLLSDQDLLRWKEAKKKDYMARVKVLEDLQMKLLSPIPDPKKVKEYRLYKNAWSIGSMFTYTLTGEFAKKYGYENAVILIQKIDECIWYPGHIIPIVYIFMPVDINGITSVNFEDYRRVVFYYENEKPVYRLCIVETSNKSIPKDRISNFSEPAILNTPIDEYLPPSINLLASSWSRLEKTVVKSYRFFNLGINDV